MSHTPRALRQAPSVATAREALKATHPTQAQLDAMFALIQAMIDAGPSAALSQETTQVSEPHTAEAN